MPNTKSIIRPILTAAALLAALATTGVARAADITSTDEARALSYGDLTRMKPMDVMHMVDKDGKGYITQEDLAAFERRLFERMDRDHNGKVTPDEWMGSPAAHARAAKK
jgi:hypothetical protein